MTARMAIVRTKIGPVMPSVPPVTLLMLVTLLSATKHQHQY